MKKGSAGSTKSPRSKRAAGPITLSPKLAEMLGALRAAKGITATPELMLVDLRAAEKVLRGELPDDLVGYYLAMGLGFAELIEMTRSVRTFYEASEENVWRDVAKTFTYVAIDEDYNPDEGPLCVKLGNDAPAQMRFWFLRKADAWEPSFEKPSEPIFVSYLKWKYPDVDFKSAKAAPVEVRLLAGLPPAPKKRVTHPKFGEGVVVNEIPPDKVEVDFGPPNGVRKLLKGPWFG